MSQTTLCPTCHAAPLTTGEGHLDQSGATFLPTLRWSCPVCGYERLAPAKGARWRSGVHGAPLVIALVAA